MLYLHSNDPSTAAQTLRRGIDRLVAEIPWLAGDVVIHKEPESRGFIHLPRTAPHEVPVLRIKYFDSDEAFRTHPTGAISACFFSFHPRSNGPSCASSQLFPSKIALVMSFSHMAFDGSGAGTVLQALSECCRVAAARSLEMPVTQTILGEAISHRTQVSASASECQTRLDHILELGPSAFDSNLTTEQWGAMESALSSASTMHPDRIRTGTPSHIFMVADLRCRINPPLPETYMGNMIYPGIGNIMTPSNHVDFLNLTQLALELRTKVISNMNEALAKSCCAAVSEGGDWYRLEGKPADVVMTSWRHLKVYSLYFGPGLGYIEDFESGLALIPGACIMLPQRTREVPPTAPVQWEASVTLRPGNYETLVKDPAVVSNCAHLLPA
ncbi:hypothetical protein BDV10DRAFT_192909 [Aspergillus recurvatus]